MCECHLLGMLHKMVYIECISSFAVIHCFEPYLHIIQKISGLYSYKMYYHIDYTFYCYCWLNVFRLDVFFFYFLMPSSAPNMMIPFKESSF